MKRRHPSTSIVAAIALGIAAIVVANTSIAGELDHVLVLGAARAGDRIIAVGEWGIVASSVDGGLKWKLESSPVGDTLTDVQFLDPRQGWAVGHNGVIVHTGDGGKSWVDQTPDRASVDPLLGVHFFEPGHGFAVGAFGTLLETFNGGSNWTRRDIGQRDMHLKAIAGSSNGALYIAGESGTIFRSSNSGRDFEPIQTGYSGSFWGLLAIQDNAILAYGMRGTIFRSDDRGRTWTAVPSQTRAGLSAGVVASPGHIVLAGAEGTFLESRDNGRTFAAATLPNRNSIDAAVAVTPDTVLLLGRAAPVVQKVHAP